MSLEYSYKDIEWCQGLFHKSDECFCDCNIIIPDSMDDIAKIISVKASPAVSDSKCEKGKITVNGQVKITLLYVGENESSKVFTLTVNQSFSHIINAPEITEDFLSLVKVHSCSTSYSMVNSRRIKASAAIRFSAASYKNHRAKALTYVSGAEARSIEKSIISARCICTKSLIITDTADIGAGKAPISSLLKHHVRISDYDFKPLNNKVIVKGNLSVCILYNSDDSLTDATITIPFTEVLEAEGVSTSCITNVSLSVADCDIRPDTDLAGEYKMLDVNIVLSACITAFTKDTITAVGDLYLPHGALNKTTLPITVESSLCEITEEEFVKDTVNIPVTAPAILRVIDTECRIGEISLSDSAATTNAEITLMYLSGDNSAINTYTTKIPLAHSFAAKALVNPSCDCDHMGYAITGDNSLELRLNLKFKAICSECESLSIITDCVEDNYTPPVRSSVIVSFVNEGDSLWSIAKKHNIAVSHLAKANAIDENAILTVGEKLIIPR